MYCLAYHTVFDFKCLVNKMGVYKDDKRVNARIFFFLILHFSSDEPSEGCLLDYLRLRKTPGSS